MKKSSLLNNDHSILIFDEYEIVRNAMENILLRNFPEFIVFLSDRIEDFIDIVKTMLFDLVIVDISHNGINEFSLIRKIKALNPKSKILVFSFFTDENFTLRCLRNGASGVLNKNCKEEKICRVVNVLMNGGSFFSKDVKLNLKVRKNNKKNKYSSGDLNKLSNREFELANLLVLGYTNLDVSRKLKIATSTVSTYKKRIFLKMNTENVLQLAEILKKNKGF